MADRFTYLETIHGDPGPDGLGLGISTLAWNHFYLAHHFTSSAEHPLYGTYFGEHHLNRSIDGACAWGPRDRRLMDDKKQSH